MLIIDLEIALLEMCLNSLMTDLLCLTSYMKDVFEKSFISQPSLNQKKKLHNETKTNTKEDHLWSKL